jgi:hypothetical protein
MQTHKFKGGPFDHFTLQFPRPTVLDSAAVAWIEFPRGVTLEGAFCWSDFQTGQTEAAAPPSTGSHAVYRRADDRVWDFVPRNTAQPRPSGF